MVPKIHAKGCSFRGIAQYLLHDKHRAESSDRVEWTATRNLCTEDPELAWKLMAATAMDSDRLKANAGIKNTGRKSQDSVLHVSLAWHPKEGEDLIPEEMQRAANLAIRALGAEDRQVLIVAHNDETQPHVHLVINRVSPMDGRMLSSSKEKLNLSRFAQEYEEQRGEILCEQRKINNDARDRGEYVRGEKDVPRHIYEQHSANDNRPGKAERHRTQREKDLLVGKAQRVIKNRQAKAWADLMRVHKERLAAIRAEQKVETLRACDAIQKAYRNNQWKQLFHEHQAEMRAFERDERTFLGRMRNRVKSIDFRELVGGEDRVRTIGEAFDALSSSGARKQWLERNQAKRENALKSEQRTKEAQAAVDAREAAKKKLSEARTAFAAERAALVFKCAGESAKMRTEWKQRAAGRMGRPTSTIPAPDTGGRQDIELDQRLRGLLENYERRIDQYEQRREQSGREIDRDDEIDR